MESWPSICEAKRSGWLFGSLEEPHPAQEADRFPISFSAGYKCKLNPACKQGAAMNVTAGKLVRLLGRIFVGIYNILAAYLVGWVVVLATVALGLHFLTELAVAPFGFERADLWWRSVERAVGVEAAYLRLPLYGIVLAAVMYLGRRPLQWLQGAADRGLDVVLGWFRSAAADRPWLANMGRLGATVAVTAVLIPFVVQPTLVGGGMSFHHWVERGANLTDGTASRHLIDSVAGTYRQWFADDVESQGGISGDDWEGGQTPFEAYDDVDGEEVVARGGISEEEWDRQQPLLDRWDPLIEQAVGGDAELFAKVKAVMQIESSGRQFAVSHTGCAGLMQFCAGTARRQPFRRIFGAGAVYECGCHPNCSTPEEVSRALESGNRDSIAGLEGRFPCSLTDSRFDGEKSIHAGTKYIEKLGASYGGNLYLIYIGYNSGPGVANEVWRRTGRDSAAELADIEPHLTAALRPHFGSDAASRARGLLDVHLPRLGDAYEQHSQTARAAGMTSGARTTAWAPQCRDEDFPQRCSPAAVTGSRG